MKYNYTVLFEEGKYALIERGEKYPEYAVVIDLKPESERKYEGSDWGCTCGYTEHTANGLSRMLDFFRSKTEEDYIGRPRLEELATQFKDGLLETNLGKEEYEEFFNYECGMNVKERKFFGLNESEEQL